MSKRPRTVQHTPVGTGQVIVVLEGASLEVAPRRPPPSRRRRDPAPVDASRSNAQLLSGEEHATLISKRLGRDPADYRPDIVHQCLLTLLDSPLNKAGRLRVYVHTARNVLVEVHPHIRIPRTYRRFSGLMAQLLHKLRVRATNSSDTLLRVIGNPVTSHLPPGCRKILLTYPCDRLRDVRAVAVDDIGDDEPVAFIVGAISRGEIACEWADESMSISEYPCSASVVCGRVCNAFEGKYGIL